MLIDKPALAALVGRSLKAVQETRGEACVFSNTKPLPPVKSAAVEEIQSPCKQMTDRLASPQAISKDKVVSAFSSGKSVSSWTQELYLQAVQITHLCKLKV